jgi:hypothetical protein
LIAVPTLVIHRSEDMIVTVEAGRDLAAKMRSTSSCSARTISGFTETHRVRVPHLTRPKLIASPHGRRHLRDHVEHAASTILVVGQPLRTIYGLSDVRNVSTEPNADLVAEDPKSACPPAADRPLGDDAPLLAAPVVDRRLLDNVLPP